MRKLVFTIAFMTSSVAMAGGQPVCETQDAFKIFDAGIGVCIRADGDRYKYPPDLWSSNPAEEPIIRQLNEGYLPADDEPLEVGAWYAKQPL